jgi:heterodisulfide reductase subunit A
MMDVGRHPRIELMVYSEVEAISGYVGNFQVRVRRKARYVDEDACTACGDCVQVCPVTSPDEFQAGLSTRKAIHIPFPQAVPSAYLINARECLGNNPIACGKCREVCEKDCIDFDMLDEIKEFEVGAVIVATGLEVFDPTGLSEYGYTRYGNVITSIEFERLISSGGPTEGLFVRPTDMRRPRSIGFVQCVGSRTTPAPGSNGRQSIDRGRPYCSNICCMNTVKDSLLLLDHYPDTDISVYYMDIRAFGKGFEDMYRRSKEAGVKYIRGLPGQILEDASSQNLHLLVENTMTGELERHEHEMIVLSLGLVPPEDQGLIKQLLTLSTTEDGFFLESHPKLKPVDAPTRGVYFAGCAEGPKDVKDAVTQASAAAARAQTILNRSAIKLEPVVARIDPLLCNACGRCVRVCPYHAIVGGDAKNKIKAQVIEAMCQGCGTCAPECARDAITIRHFTDVQMIAQIDAALAETPYEKILVFACNWCSYAGADFAGVSRLQYPPSARVIRTMCSGRVDPDFVVRAFEKGAAMVLVSGCHYADCHYIDANRQTVKRVDRLWNQLERKGIRPERLQLEWISAAEGKKWAQVMADLEEMRKTVTLQEVNDTQELMRPNRQPSPTSRS